MTLSWALSTRIHIHLKTQLFLSVFRPHVFDENDQWKRNCENSTSGRNFFKNGEKSFLIQTNTGTSGQGLNEIPPNFVHEITHVNGP